LKDGDAASIYSMIVLLSDHYLDFKKTTDDRNSERNEGIEETKEIQTKKGKGKGKGKERTKSKRIKK